MSDVIKNSIIAANHIYFCAAGETETIDSTAHTISKSYKPTLTTTWNKIGIVDDIAFTPNQTEIELTAPTNFINQVVRKVTSEMRMVYDITLKSVDNMVINAMLKTTLTTPATAEGDNLIFVPGSTPVHEGWFKWMMVDPGDAPGDGSTNNVDANGNVILLVLDVYGSYTIDGVTIQNSEFTQPKLHITQLISDQTLGKFNRQGIYVASA